MDWRRFRLLNDRELKLTGDAVGRAFTTWSEDWARAPEHGDVRCVAACEGPITTQFRESDRWLCAGGTEGPLAWIWVPDRLRSGLARNLFGELAGGGEGRSELLPAVVDSSLRSLLELLVAEGGGEKLVEPSAPSASQPPGHVWARGSGAVLCEFRVGEVGLGMVLAEAWVRKTLAPFRQAQRRLPLPVDPRLGLESSRVRLTVWAGSTEVELGLLQTLAPGDVVKVDLAIDRPMHVSIEGRDTGRRVFLGCLGNGKAVQFGPPQ